MLTPTYRLLVFVALVLVLTGTRAHALDAKTVYASASPSVVLIQTYDQDGTPLMIGTGFFVGNGKALVTNLHVVAGASSVSAKISAYETIDLGQELSADPMLDLALFRLKRGGRALRLADADPAVGEEVLAIGNPRGLEKTLSTGIVSGIREDPQLNAHFYQITAPISPGSSGGPVLSQGGAVLGISTFYVQDGQNLNFAVPARYIQRLLGSSHIYHLSQIQAHTRSNGGPTIDEEPRESSPGHDQPITVTKDEDGTLIFK